MEIKERIQFTVAGSASPQGSKQGFYRAGRVVLVEASKNLKPWRIQVANAAQAQAKAQGWEVMDKTIAAHVSILFRFEKPKSVRRIFHTVKPDLDKLIRGILDGLTQSGVIWQDDSQVVSLFVAKEYGEAETVIEVAYSV